MERYVKARNTILITLFLVVAVRSRCGFLFPWVHRVVPNTFSSQTLYNVRTFSQVTLSTTVEETLDNVVKKHTVGDQTKNCHYRGGLLPRRHDCPAKGKQCRAGGKLSHFVKVCSSAVQYVQRETLISMHHHVNQHHQVMMNCFRSEQHSSSINDNSVQFIVDTSASVNIADSTVYERFAPRPTLKHQSLKVFDYGSQAPRDAVGPFEADADLKNRSSHTSFYVRRHGCNGATNSLLSGETARQLGPIQSALGAQTTLHGTTDGFPELFIQRMGKFKGANTEEKLETLDDCDLIESHWSSAMGQPHCNSSKEGSRNLRMCWYACGKQSDQA